MSVSNEYYNIIIELQARILALILMPRKKRLEEDAEQVAVYLTPKEKLVMDVIAGRRKKRKEERTSPSEIVVDGLWKILTEGEGISKEKIDELLAVPTEDATTDNLKVFPKN